MQRTCIWFPGDLPPSAAGSSRTLHIYLGSFSKVLTVRTWDVAKSRCRMSTAPAHGIKLNLSHFGTSGTKLLENGLNFFFSEWLALLHVLHRTRPKPTVHLQIRELFIESSLCVKPPSQSLDAEQSNHPRAFHFHVRECDSNPLVGEFRERQRA